MKTKIISLFAIFVILSCISQKPTFERQIDIFQFERKTYYTEDSTWIQQFGGGGGVYVKKTAKKDSLHLNYYEYNENGKLIIRGRSIRRGSGALGKRYTYDEKAEIIKIIDYEEGFVYGWDYVVEFAKKNNMNLSNTEIYKGNDWEIVYIGKYKDLLGEYAITINPQTGDELVMIYTGEDDPNFPSHSSPILDTIYYKGKYHVPTRFYEAQKRREQKEKEEEEWKRSLKY